IPGRLRGLSPNFIEIRSRFSFILRWFGGWSELLSSLVMDFSDSTFTLHRLKGNGVVVPFGALQSFDTEKKLGFLSLVVRVEGQVYRLLFLRAKQCGMLRKLAIRYHESHNFTWLDVYARWEQFTSGGQYIARSQYKE